MKADSRGKLWPVMMLAFGLAACGGSDTSEPDPQPEASRAPSMERPDAGGPALPQPDRASAPLVSEETVRADPVTIFDMQTPVRAVGQEPDWEVIFEDGWIVFERPGLPLVEVPLPELPDGANGVMEFDAGRMRVTLTRDGCDGPGGSLDVRIGFEDVTYVGCGGSHEGSVAQAASVSWQNLIVDYGPAIDACLSEASGKRLVRALYPREENTVGMILVDEIGRHEECGANSVSGEISFFDPVTTDQAEIWLDGPAVFARSELGLVCSSVSPQQDIEIGDGFGVLYPAGCKA